MELHALACIWLMALLGEAGFYVLDRIHAHTLSQYLVALECLSCDRSFDYFCFLYFYFHQSPI